MRYLDEKEEQQQLDLVSNSNSHNTNNNNGNSSTVVIQNKLSKSKTSAGNRYYHQLCMQAVNQSIGRSIRHLNDYAVTVLLDQRFSNRNEVHTQLPQWIQNRLVHASSFGHGFSQITQFFQKKKKSKDRIET